MSEVCPKCGCKLDNSSKARNPTWVRFRRPSERWQRPERIFCRKCAVEFFADTPNPFPKIEREGEIITINNWKFDTARKYSKAELVYVYTLWRGHHGYASFHVFKNFFEEIFSRAYRKCKMQNKPMLFSDLLEVENTERTSCKWDWTTD